jgi:hypothetical protein
MTAPESLTLCAVCACGRMVTALPSKGPEPQRSEGEGQQQPAYVLPSRMQANYETQYPMWVELLFAYRKTKKRFFLTHKRRILSCKTKDREKVR